MDELTPIETGDIDSYVGVPLGGEQQKHPFSINDIRRFALAMANPNPLHWDENYAAESRFGQIIAPQSFLGGSANQGAYPSRMGHIPGTHALIGGDEYWWYGPRIQSGDTLRVDRMMYDYRVTNTRFGGPTLFTRGDSLYVNHRGEFVAKQRNTVARYLVENAQKLRRGAQATDQEPGLTQDQLGEISDRKVAYLESVLNHPIREFDSVQIGQQLPQRLVGPHTTMSLTLELHSGQGPGGNYHDPLWPDSVWPQQWADTPDVGLSAGEHDRLRSILNQLFSPGGTSHVDPQQKAIARSYGYGGSMAAWFHDHLANWAGENGFLRYAKIDYRGMVYVGDVTYLEGEVTRTFVNERTGAPTVEVSERVTNQNGTLLANGTAQVELSPS